jgi:hypothetical protein
VILLLGAICLIVPSTSGHAPVGPALTKPKRRLGRRSLATGFSATTAANAPAGKPRWSAPSVWLAPGAFAGCPRVRDIGASPPQPSPPLTWRGGSNSHGAATRGRPGDPSRFRVRAMVVRQVRAGRDKRANPGLNDATPLGVGGMSPRPADAEP